MANDNDFFSDVEGLDGLDDAPDTASVPEQSVGAVYEDLYEEGQQAPAEDDMSEVDAQMAAVEQRLEIAQFYKLLLGHDLFGSDYRTNKAARRVQKEVQVFARERLGALMGVTQEKRQDTAVQVQQFTDLETATLKQIAATVIQRAQQAGKPPPPPTLTPVEKVPAAPAAKPSLQPMKPAEKPVSPRQAAPQPKPAPRAPPRPAPQAKPLSRAMASMMERVPERYRSDPTLKLENGRILVHAKTEDGVPLYIHDKAKGTKTPMFKDVTLPAKPGAGSPQPLPTPSIAQYGVVMQQQADAALNFAERKARSMGIGDHMALATTHGFSRTTEED